MASTARKRSPSPSGGGSANEQHGKRQRIPATCEWILREAAYKSWKSGASDEPSLLWIHGPPGCGKTFLAQFIIDDLRQEQTRHAPLYQFCDAESTPSTVIQSILSQVTTTSILPDDTRVGITQSTSEASAGGRTVPLDATHRLYDTLSTVVSSLPDLTLVIDGLDEIPERYLRASDFDLTSKLVALRSQGDGHTRVLISSRTQPDIRKALKDLPSILLTEDLVKDDLHRYIESEVKKYSELDQRSSAAVKAVLEQSEGSFIWASLAVQSLATSTSLIGSNGGPERFYEYLQRVPTSLDDLYDQIISQQAEMLTAGQKILRNQILRWLLFAVRSLHLPELAHAIAVESNIYIQDLATQATEVCGSLIKIENSQLKLVHHTLREYLLRDIESRTTTIDVDRKQSNLAIAKTLLTYLSHPPSAGIEEPLYDPHYMRTRPIAEYAALYWVYHISNASQNSDLLQQIGQFVDSANFVEWADRLLPHFLPLSMLPTPPRPFNNARFFHLLALKGQLCTYFPESKSVEFTNKIETRLRLVYEGFLAEAKAKSGRTSLDVVQRLLDLSELYSWLPGYKSQTRAMLLESSEIISKHISADAGDLSITVTQALADEYKRAGKYPEAKGLLEQFLSNDSLESKDPRRMFALDGLGWVHMRLNNLEAAEITLRNALNLATDLYGKQSPMTLRSKVTLAEVLGKIGRHTEAEALCDDLKEQLRQHRHDGVAMSRDSVSQLNTLAMIFAQEEKYEDAKNTWQVVVDDRRKAFGMEHGMTLFAEMQLGNAMKKAGDEAGAKSLFVNLLPRQEKVLGGKHPNVQEVKQQLS